MSLGRIEGRIRGGARGVKGEEKSALTLCHRVCGRVRSGGFVR